MESYSKWSQFIPPKEVLFTTRLRRVNLQLMVAILTMKEPVSVKPKTGN
jgi:hypothetical protein